MGLTVTWKMNLEYEITSSTGLANVKISKVTALGDDVSGGIAVTAVTHIAVKFGYVGIAQACLA